MTDKVYTTKDLENLRPEERETYIEGCLYEGQIVGLIGQQKAGKSYLWNQISVHLAEGTDWGDGRLSIPKPRNVLCVQTEGGALDLAERINPVVKSIDATGRRWAASIPTILDLRTGDGLAEIEKIIESLDIEVVGFDALYTSMSGTTASDENIGAVKQSFRRLQLKFPKLSIIYLHHEHRARFNHEGERAETAQNRFAGSWAIMAMVDMSWHFTLDENQHGERRYFEVANIRSRFQGVEPFFVDMDYDSGILEAESYQLNDSIVRMRLHIKALDWISTKDFHAWCKDQNIPRSTIYRNIDKLKKSGHIKEAVREVEKGSITKGLQWSGR